MRGSVLLLALLLSFSAPAADHQPQNVKGGDALTIAGIPCPDQIPSDQVLKEILLRIYKPYIRTTERDVAFYHYGWRTPRFHEGAPPGVFDDTTSIPASGTESDYLGPVDMGQKANIDGKEMKLADYYFKVKADSHFKAPPTSEFGAGLYAQCEPLGSVVYSGKGGKGMLLRVGVPKGMKYVDLRDPRKELPSTEAEMMTFACAMYRYDKSNAPDENYLRRLIENKKPTVRFYSLLYYKKFRDLLKDTFKEMGVHFITGNFGNVMYNECRQHKNYNWMTDAIFLDPDSTPQLKLDILVPEIGKNPPPEKRKLYEEALDYFDAYTYDDQIFAAQKPKLTPEFLDYYTKWSTDLRGFDPSKQSIEEYQKAQAAKWTKERRAKLTDNIFGCSKAHPGERFFRE